MKYYRQAGTVVFLLVLVFGLSLFLGGCTILNNDKAVEDDNWEDDVLWARECGQDGLRCCAGEQPCHYEQECCVDPNNAKRNRCSDSCECGVAGDFCCAGNTCNEGLACDSGFCSPCGELNQPCCAGESKCGDDLVCHQNKCVICGTPGNPCCEGTSQCQNQDKTDRSRTDCINGLCIYCGSFGKIVCESEPVCAPGNLINNGYCLICGGVNQPCCRVASGVDYVCDPQANLECDRGFCSEK